MKQIQRRWACAAALAAAIAASNSAESQTFLTTETNLTAPPFGLSQLHRFDAESETYAVAAGADSAFQGVTLLDGAVLVADFAEGRIQRFAFDGSLLAPFASFDAPTFLESDNAGNVYTTQFSLGPAVATRFDSSGGVTATFTSPSASAFTGIDADAMGNVYVATTSGTLEKFAADGTFLGSVSVSGTPLDLAVDELGMRLYLADESSNMSGIQVFDIGSAAPGFLRTIPTPADSAINGLHYADAVNELFAVDSGLVSDDPRGLQLAMDGALLATYRPVGPDIAFDVVHRVPEPATCALAALGAMGWSRRVRRTIARQAIARLIWARCSEDSWR